MSQPFLVFRKRPFSRNQNTGNVALSIEEAQLLTNSIDNNEDVVMRVELPTKSFDVKLTKAHIATMEVKRSRKYNSKFVTMSYLA